MIKRLSQVGYKNTAYKQLNFYVNGGNNSGRDPNFWINFNLELIYG